MEKMSSSAIISIVLLIMVCIHNINTKPIFGIDDDDDDFGWNIPSPASKCKDLGCPNATTSCSKKQQTTEDLQNIVTTIECKDANGHLLKNTSNTEPNPLPNTSFQNFEYYGSFAFGGNPQTSSTVQNTGGSTKISTGTSGTTGSNNDAVETFDKK